MSIKTIIMAAIHGFLLAVFLFLGIMATHEDHIFDQIVENTVSDNMSDSDAVVSLVNATHELLDANFQIIARSSSLSLRERYFGSADIQLASPKGHCGSYAHVLARLLQRAGFKVRIAQMDCSNNEKSCHILVEALLEERYVVVDGMYNLSFSRADGSLATFTEVGSDWQNYRSQVPDGYPAYYNYHAVRYTNWEKIPVIMPAIKQGLTWLIGREIEELSLRPYFLNVYKVYSIFLLSLYVTILLVYMSIRQRLRSRFNA